MEPEALARLTEQFERLVRERLPGAPIQRVTILQYGDDPEIEPGQLLARIYIEAADDQQAREQAMEEFHQAHRTAVHELRRDMDRLPGVGPVEILAGSGEGEGADRADAVRWALARIRERPAYTQLQQRAREIEELKAQF